MGRGSKNWETHSVVANQPQESSNPILNENEIVKGQFTWEEIRRHSTKNDRWLVIDGRVYNITNWLKHPGGQMLLNHYAGQDASVRQTMESKLRFDLFFLSGSISFISSGNKSRTKVSQTVLYR
jgi:predicted heme/steroid binding protein